MRLCIRFTTENVFNVHHSGWRLGGKLQDAAIAYARTGELPAALGVTGLFTNLLLEDWGQRRREQMLSRQKQKPC